MQEVLWTIIGWICKGIYNEYRWNPKTCRFEHKETGEPLYSWAKPVATKRRQEPMPEMGWDAPAIPEDKPIITQPQKQRPEWLWFLFEENIGTLLEKRKRKKQAEKRDRENGTWR